MYIIPASSYLSNSISTSRCNVYLYLDIHCEENCSQFK